MIPISILRSYFPLIKNRKLILPEIFKNKDRVYIPFEGKIGGRPHKYIRIWLKSNGYKLVDYKKGLVRNISKGSPIRLGKLLRKNNMMNLLHLFENDPFRMSCRKDKFVIVLSRHPYDLLGMSVGRGWTSCFNLENETTEEKLLKEIEQEDIIFYLCEENDTNIQNPIGRLLFGKTKNNKYTLRTNIYGAYTEGFVEACCYFLKQYNMCQVLENNSVSTKSFLEPKDHISPKQFSLNWRERLEYFKITQSILAKHDKHHLVRYLYYVLYSDDDAEHDENIAIRFLYHSKKLTDEDFCI